MKQGKPIAQNQAASRGYARALNKLIAQMQNEYRNALPLTELSLERFRQKWVDVFKKQAPDIAKAFVDRMNESVMKLTDSSLKELGDKVNIPPLDTAPSTRRFIKSATSENVDLIVSIPEKFHDQLKDFIKDHPFDSHSIADRIKADNRMMREISKRWRNARKRAEFIARDQTGKLTAQLSRERVTAAGVTHFKWLHSRGGAEPRELHLRLNGQVFAYDDPPVIDERTGEKGYPGQLPNCGCIAIPIIDVARETPSF